MGERPDEIERRDPLTGGLGAEGETGGYAPDVTWGVRDTVTDTSDTGAFGGTVEATTPVDTDDDLEATRAQIEETRADMTETIDAIQQRLSPQNLAQQAKETVRDATIGKAEAAVNNAGETAKGFGSIALETIRQNPIPAALAGISIGWLLTRGRQQSSAPRYYRTDTYSYGGPSQGYAGNVGTYPYGEYDSKYAYDAERDQSSGVGQTMSRAQEAAGNAVGQAQSVVGETVSQAQDAAGRVASQVGDTASNVASQVSELNLIDTVRQNPIPAALVGIGLGWLYMNSRNQSSGAGYYPYRSYSYGQTTTPYRDYDYGYGDQSSRSSGGQAMDQVQAAASNAVNQAQDTAGQLAGQAQNVAGQVQNQVNQLGDTAQYRAQRAAGGFQQLLQEQPLAVGAAAAAVGLAIGLAVPETPQENQFFGPARDNLVDQAQQAAQQAAEKVQTVAQEAVSAAKDEAQNQGLA